ncbi:MAG: hypothetical protein IPM79_26385 [Polyangiaceae bacterium]|nr:hypothetical protein [Polyangiaceae bacterium]
MLWQPITATELQALVQEQEQQLSRLQQDRFAAYRVKPWSAVLVRSSATGPEPVFVVAQRGNKVLYFDDVEFGFEVAVVDAEGQIVNPGAPQNVLADVVDDWWTFASE